MSEYERHAAAVAAKIGLVVDWKLIDGKAPPWNKSGVHGWHYKITLIKGRRRISFDWWDSKHAMDHGTDPTIYGILSSVSAEMTSPTDPDEVVREYGQMLPSQAIAVAAFAKKLQRFFTPSEQEALSEIQ